MKKVDKLEKDCITEFQRYREQVIEEIMAFLTEEQNEKENFDYVVIAVANEGKVNTCSKCLSTYSKQISICPICQLDANNFPEDCDPYHRTESKHTQEKPHVYIGGAMHGKSQFNESCENCLKSCISYK